MEKYVSTRTLSLAGALLLAALAPLASSARTPDGLTPSQETVCDDLRDATSGLYGLCVAYCEAQDCDSIDSAISGQCRAPSPKLLELYERKRGVDDPPMPCEAPAAPNLDPCRCYGPEDLRTVALSECTVHDFGSGTALALSDAGGIDGAMVEMGSGWGVCTKIENGSASVIEIDEAEAIACEAVLRYHADATGLVCR